MTHQSCWGQLRESWATQNAFIWGFKLLAEWSKHRLWLALKRNRTHNATARAIFDRKEMNDSKTKSSNQKTLRFNSQK